MQQLIRISKALSDATRLRILLALEGRELCVCEIVALIGLAPSTISKHLALLSEAGLVRSRKLGRWVHFSRADSAGGAPPPPPAVREALAWASAALQGDAQAAQDRRALKSLQGRMLDQLCPEKPRC